MKQRFLTEKQLERFLSALRNEEKSAATLEKYRRDTGAFFHFLPPDTPVSKELVIAYKQRLAQTYKTASANSMLVAVNRLLSFLGWDDCRVRMLKAQRRIFREADRELTKAEYFRLLEAAGRNERLHLLMQTICSTGIRVGELPCITCEALAEGRARVRCKGKERIILLPKQLRARLLRYCRAHGVRTGCIFVTRSGRPLNRSNIWTEMKRLCAAAEVDPAKVFPHNLRHLFAVTFYRQHRDIVRLADILGHSNIETTRIYTVTSGSEHGRQIDCLGLLAG